MLEINTKEYKQGVCRMEICMSNYKLWELIQQLNNIKDKEPVMEDFIKALENAYYVN